MGKHKLTEIEKKVKNYILPPIDFKTNKIISHSQFTVWDICPYKWSMRYIEKKIPYEASIHTVFGTAIHETLQEYISVMYNQNGVAADKLDLDGIFTKHFTEKYSEEYKKAGAHFTTPEEMGEFYEDAVAILEYIKKNRNKLFTIRKRVLLGIEIPLLIELRKNVYYKGAIDVALYDLDLDKVYIIDIKTSTSGWRDREKKNETKVSQIILYKEFFSKQFGVDIDKIEVEYFIVKRKLIESEFVIPRTQSFKPASGKIKVKKSLENLEKFIEECFDESGNYKIKSYIKTVGEKSCKFCPLLNNSDLCNKTN